VIAIGNPIATEVPIALLIPIFHTLDTPLLKKPPPTATSADTAPTPIPAIVNPNKVLGCLL